MNFICYLLIGFLALIGVVKKRWAVVITAVVTWISLITITSVPNLNHQFNFIHFVFWKNILELVPIFLTGSIIFLVAGEDTGFRLWWLSSQPGCFFPGGLLP